MIDELFNSKPFSLAKSDKEQVLTRVLTKLTEFHYESCREYRGMLDALGFDPCADINSYYEFPMLPVQLFKEMTLKSVKDEDVFKVLSSSGTTGQAVSKIYLDKSTASAQQKALVKIVSDFTGSGRMPMLIIDSPSVISDRAKFSARGAGILGFSIFASDKVYALDDNMEIDMPAVEEFLKKHAGKKILVFGFTFMVWQHFYKELIRSGYKPDLSSAILIHGGGWKKLVSESVYKSEFKRCLTEACGMTDIHDYYGMVEQTGCVYMECKHGQLHASIFSDVITRRYSDFSVCDLGESGIIQVVSTIPESYPGHSLLTEDEGVILGQDDCPCGRKGKYFHIIGRLKQAEIRGCSDTYADSR